MNGSTTRKFKRAYVDRCADCEVYKIYVRQEKTRRVIDANVSHPEICYCPVIDDMVFGDKPACDKYYWWELVSNGEKENFGGLK